MSRNHRRLADRGGVAATQGDVDPPHDVAVFDDAIAHEATARARAARGPGTIRVGDVLTTTVFEDGRPATATVREYNQEHGALLWIERLGRVWPVRADLVADGAWTHEPGDYPPVGEDADFDAKHRPALADVARDMEPGKATISELGALALAAEPPRPARKGYVWARTVGMVGGTGFSVTGERRTRWAHDELGEFQSRVVAESPAAFRIV